MCPSKYLRKCVCVFVCEYVKVCVCPGGTPVSALSQDPGTFQNTGTRPHNKRPRQRDLSTIHHRVTQRHTHTHTHTHSESITYEHVDTTKMTNLPERMWMSRAHKKMRRGQMCTQRRLTYESAYRGDGGGGEEFF